MPFYRFPTSLYDASIAGWDKTDYVTSQGGKFFHISYLQYLHEW